MVRLHWEDAVSCNAWYTLSSEKFRRRAVLLAKTLGRLAWLSDMLKELGPKCHDQLAMPITLQVLVRLNATLYRLYLRDSSCRLPKVHCWDVSRKILRCTWKEAASLLRRAPVYAALHV
jgi:hypothetical protein